MPDPTSRSSPLTTRPARPTTVGGWWLVRDLGSWSGTFLNGRLIEVAAADGLRFGGTDLLGGPKPAWTLAGFGPADCPRWSSAFLWSRDPSSGSWTCCDPDPVTVTVTIAAFDGAVLRRAIAPTCRHCHWVPCPTAASPRSCGVWSRCAADRIVVR